MERVQRYAPKSPPAAVLNPAPPSHSASPPVTPAAAFALHFLTSGLARFAQTHREKAQSRRDVPTTLGDCIRAAKVDLDSSRAAFLAGSTAPQPHAGRGDGFGSATVVDAAAPVSSSRHSTLVPGHQDEKLEAAVRCYNPTIHRAVLHRVSARIAVPETLRMAGQLAQYMHEAASAAPRSAPIAPDSSPLEGESPVSTQDAVALLRRAMAVCQARYADGSAKPTARGPCRVSPTLWALCPSAREGAGIAARLHAGGAATSAPHRRRRQLPSCFLRYASDVQVHEVLPSGAVVHFTHATRPEDVGLRDTAPTEQRDAQDAVVAADSTGAAAPRTKGRRRLANPPSFMQSLEAVLASEPAVVHLHFVLHRTRISLAGAVAEMVDAGEGLITADDVSVNVDAAENDEHVVTQLCSVRVAPAPQSCADEEARQRCLHLARCLVQVNRTPDAPSAVPRVALQLLTCSRDPCGPVSVNSAARLQYAVLLRGIEQRGGPVNQIEHAVLTCAAALPNFFAPTHFGPADVPFFRTYHVTEAVQQRRYAAAAAMLLCLHVDPVAADVPAVWLAHALRLLCCGEEREGVWQAWWRHAVPAGVRDGVRWAKAELVWNVVASCRLRELAAATGGQQDVLLAAPPEPGDFVQQRDDVASEEVPDGASWAAAVQPVLDQEAGSRHSVRDVVVPLLLDANAAGCERVADVEAQLGFRPARGARGTRAATGAETPRFRPLLVEATGHPRAARPWCRTFAESASSTAAGLHVAEPGNSPTLALATDWELTGHAAATRDYAARSRGPKAVVWPVSKRGRPLTDRLPVGLLAAASADGSSLLSNPSAIAHHGGSRCLAMHCTLPACVPLTSLIAEFAALDDLRDA